MRCPVFGALFDVEGVGLEAGKLASGPRLTYDIDIVTSDILVISRQAITKRVTFFANATVVVEFGAQYRFGA
ncbi:MAG: hypothetical protein FIB00_12590 [Chloroflexi bacterium]|nr:hypothetical protein [Chloroflexota bacterium]PWB45572.1 MAG: hypothetical protein C3F10_05655 [Dehalococcoidia bacterium]